MGAIQTDPGFAGTAAQCLAAPKMARARFRWHGKSHAEYVRAQFPVEFERSEGRRAVGYVILSAHRYRTPPKYSFLLSYLGQRILALDVGPARTHLDVHTLTVVRSTHWHVWPCDGAEPDTRDMGHQAWFREFLKRSNVMYGFPYTPPPYGMQLGLKL
jgi:hypothetical protein